MLLRRLFLWYRLFKKPRHVDRQLSKSHRCAEYEIGLALGEFFGPLRNRADADVQRSCKMPEAASEELNSLCLCHARQFRPLTALAQVRLLSRDSVKQA